MSAISVDAQELSTLYATVYCGNAISALFIYDWLVCLGQEVRFIWGGRSGLNIALVVYIFNRYGMVIQNVVAIATNFPMSDLVGNSASIMSEYEGLMTSVQSCRASGWISNASDFLSMLRFSAFSALRAYALSNRSKGLTAAIFFLTLPPATMFIARTPFFRIFVIMRISQFMQELLVIGLTWWYSYQSYCISKGISLGKTVSSLLLYNGSVYFLFLAALYAFDIICHTASVPDAVANAHTYATLFLDPITSIILCRFMLSLRQFDARMAPTTTRSGPGLDSVVLQFAAQPTDSLPPFLSSFAHPIHVEPTLFETGSEQLDEGEEMVDVVAPMQNFEHRTLPKSGL